MKPSKAVNWVGIATVVSLVVAMVGLVFSWPLYLRVGIVFGLINLLSLATVLFSAGKAAQFKEAFSWGGMAKSAFAFYQRTSLKWLAVLLVFGGILGINEFVSIRSAEGSGRVVKLVHTGKGGVGRLVILADGKTLFVSHIKLQIGDNVSKSSGSVEYVVNKCVVDMKFAPLITGLGVVVLFSPFVMLAPWFSYIPRLLGTKKIRVQRPS